MQSEKKTRAHVLVSGTVQGVFFRESTRKMAEKMNVSGWIRNLPDGRVEALFEGDEENVKKILEWAKEGPPSAKVEDIGIHYEEYEGESRGFRVLQ